MSRLQMLVTRMGMLYLICPSLVTKVVKPEGVRFTFILLEKGRGMVRGYPSCLSSSSAIPLGSFWPLPLMSLYLVSALPDSGDLPCLILEAPHLTMSLGCPVHVVFQASLPQPRYTRFQDEDVWEPHLFS